MLSKILRFIKNNWLIILILLVGLFLRSYKALPYFMYSHDQDLAGWVVKDVVVNHHPRLIGQETSSKGVFIGPLYYYLQIPFYLMANMDPMGPVFLSIIIGGLAIVSFYYVFSKVFDKRVGVIASVLYSCSTLIIFTDREVVPTTPVMLWSVWFFYTVWKLSKGQQKYYILAGALLGLVWNINLALALLTPLVLIAQLLAKKKLNVKLVLLGIVTFVVLMSPFILFETRHNFQQTKAIVGSLTTSKDFKGGPAPGIQKFSRVMQVVYVNTTKIFWGTNYPGNLVRSTFFILVAAFILLSLRKAISKNLSILIASWLILFILFFTTNPLIISEYYLNGMNVIWIGIGAVALAYGLKSKHLKFLSLLLIVMVILNLRSFFLHTTNGNGYIEKNELISFIKEDAKTRGYPCVAITYITAPGYDFGFRYLYWIAGLKIKKPLSGAPIYNIVFPLAFVNKHDQRFGGLGLVLPDYKSYTKESVEKACEGEDANLTEPLFGYTK